MAKHIYFVRHGESESNVDGIYRGRDARLTEMGRAQARAIAERIARIGVDAIVSSPFPRAHDTATAIGDRANLPVEAEELFSEWIEPSSLHGWHRDHPSVREIFEAIWSAVDPDYRHGDEESFSEIVARAARAIAFIEKHPAERLCVVTHGGFLRFMAGRMLFGESFTRAQFMGMFRRLQVGNTGVTYIKYNASGRGWEIVTWNDQNHFG